MFKNLFNKKVLSLTLGVCMIFSSASYAINTPVKQETRNTISSDEIYENVGVSKKEPKSLSSKETGEIGTYGLSKPSTSNVVDLTIEQMGFQGSAEGSTLYTNSYFKGKSTITYSITNNSSTKLTVKIFTENGWFATETLIVNANSTSTGTVSGLNTSTLYYMSFSAPSNFKGYVK